MTIRKTAGQIKEEILSHLKESPLSIEQLRIKVESNWSTTNNYLQELSKEGKVKEIISADKAKIYQRVYGDTYFDLPITDEERKKFRALFYLIMKEYKQHGRITTRTHLAKTAVYVIKYPNSGLSDLPTAWYLYGMIPLMVADPSQDYQEEIKFEHEIKIKHIIKERVKRDLPRGTGQIKKEQHIEYNEVLYTLADEFLKIINEQKLDKEKSLDILNKFFIACPTDNEFPEVFELTDRFISTVRKLSFFEDLQKFRREISLTFDALWKFIATYKFYQSITVQKRFSGRKIILDLYVGKVLEVRKNCLIESLSELYSIYLSCIDDREIEIPEDVKKIREIMQDWTGED